MHGAHLNQGHLKFEERSSLVNQELIESNSDIVCLQEVDHYEDFYGVVLNSLGYDSVCESRRGKDSVCIAYKRDQFELVKKIGIQHDDLATVYDSNEFKRGNAGIICHLRHLASKKEFFVANTHLHWNPSRDFVKFAQMVNMLKQIETMMDK